MTNTADSKKELKKAAFDQSSNSKALCESLVSNKNGEEKAKKSYGSRQNKSEDFADDEKLSKVDEDRQWLAAFTSSGSQKKPRNYENTDYLQKKQLEKECSKRAWNRGGRPMNNYKRIS